jgi:hypothetical protein
MYEHLPDGNKSTSSLPCLSSYQNNEVYHPQPQSSFYHYSDIYTTTLTPAASSYEQGESLGERETFLDSESECSASNSPPSSIRRTVLKPATSWSQRWPFSELDDDGEFELDYPEIDALGPLGTLLHELDNSSSELEVGSDAPFVRLEEHSIRDLRAEWMRRCQTLGEKRRMRTVARGCGELVPCQSVQPARTAEVVGSRAIENQV